MKIGILTQPLLGNYGGILQNYAMQRMLCKLGHEPFTIDLIPKDSLFFIIKYNIKSLLLRIIGKHVAFKKFNNKRRSDVEKFVKQNIKTTPPISSLTNFKPQNYSFQAIIVGSDQVWRPKYNLGYIQDMYFSFLHDYDCIKMSYAASFGVDEWEYSDIDTEECRKLLLKFSAISVREHSAINLIAENFKIENVSHVLDPTFLIDKADYLNLCRNIVKPESDFIGSYILDKTTEKVDFINYCASKTGLSIKCYTDHVTSSISIEEWLALFRDASLIITDSFHGTVFSIIFNKPFWVISNSKRGNSRIESLLNMFNLNKRLVDNINLIDVSANIDWTKVNQLLLNYKDNSLAFIQKTLN